MIRMAELMTAGQPAADPKVQAQVDQHYRWGPVLDAYQRDAMAVYASARLSS